MTKASDHDGPVVIVKAELFAKMIGAVTSIPEKRNTIPILENALLDVTENGLATATMTNLDMAGSVTFQASATEAVQTILPIDVIDFIRGCGKGEVTLKIAADRSFIKVNQGRARMKIATLPPGDFPLMSPPTDAFRFELPAAEMVATLSAAAPAISSDESRPYLQGVYWHIAKDQLTATTSDGHRLHVDRLPAPKGADALTGVIIDAKTVRTLVKAFGDSADAVTVAGDGNRVRISNPVTGLTFKLIDATYTDYERVIPVPGRAWCRVPVEALTAALDRMNVLRDTTRNAGAPTARLAFEEGALTVRSRRMVSDSEIEDQIDAEGEGAFSMVFQVSYLKDALGQAGTPFVRLAPGEKQDILRIDTRAHDDDGAAGDRFFLIMPRRETI